MEGEDPLSNSRPKAELECMYTKRTRAFREFLDVSISYGEMLKIIENYYHKPLVKREIVKPSRIMILFSGITIVCELNKEMNLKLNEINRDWIAEKSNVGMMLIEMAPYFQMYEQYMRYYAKASRLLNTLGSEAFETFLEEQHEVIKKAYPQKSGSLTLPSLLSLPIKRISQILLLLKELLKRTPTCHIDFGPLKSAVNIWRKLCDVVDRAAGKFAIEAEVMDLQSRIEPPRVLISRGSKRVYYINGVVKTYIPRGKESKKKNYSWYLGILFSDVFVLASSPGLDSESGEIKDQTASIRIDYITSVRRFFKSALNEDVPREVMKRTADHSLQIYGSPSSFNLQVKSWREKRRWLKVFKEAQMKRSHVLKLPFAPVWLPPFSPQATSCGICGKRLGSLFRSVHHCRECGNCVCNKCSKSRDVIHGVSTSEKDKLRICDACVQDKEIHGENEMIECLSDNKGIANAMLQQPNLRIDICEGRNHQNHRVDRFGYSKRCLGLVKGICPYLDNPAVVKEVFGELSQISCRVVRTQSHAPGELRIRWLSNTPGYLFVVVPTSRPPTWLGSRCVSTSNKIKLCRDDVDDVDGDLEMSMWRLRRVCSKKQVVIIPAADVEMGSFDTVTSWNYFVVATFQNQYPLYEDGRFLKKYSVISATRGSSNFMSSGTIRMKTTTSDMRTSSKKRKDILKTLVPDSTSSSDDDDKYAKDSLKSTSSLRDKANRAVMNRETIQKRLEFSEQVGEGLFGTEDIEMFTRAAAHEQAEVWVEEGTLSKAEFDSVPWNDNSKAWRECWLQLKKLRRNREPDIHILKRLGTLKDTDPSSAKIKTLTFTLDMKNPRLGLTCEPKTLVITEVSKRAQQFNARVGQQILEVQGTRVTTLHDVKRELQKSIQANRNMFTILVCETNKSREIAQKTLLKLKQKKLKKKTKSPKRQQQKLKKKNMQRIGALFCANKMKKTTSDIAMIGRAFYGEDINTTSRNGTSNRTMLGLDNVNKNEENKDKQKKENDVVIRACENRIQQIICDFGSENISYMPMKSYLINKFGVARFERVKSTIKNICCSSAHDHVLSGSPLPVIDVIPKVQSVVVVPPKVEGVVVVDDENDDSSSSSSSSSSTGSILGSKIVASSESTSEEDNGEVLVLGTSHRGSEAVPMLGLSGTIFDEESSGYDSSDAEEFGEFIIHSDSNGDNGGSDASLTIASNNSDSDSAD